MHTSANLIIRDQQVEWNVKVHVEYGTALLTKKKLHYIEFYGDGDSKSYTAVSNAYSGIKVNKLECVGHVQKCESCRLRNLKKRNKSIVNTEKGN